MEEDVTAAIGRNDEPEAFTLVVKLNVQYILLRFGRPNPLKILDLRKLFAGPLYFTKILGGAVFPLPTAGVPA